MRYRYEITVSHKGLGRYRVLRGDDASLLESRAAGLGKEWESLYQRRLEADAKRQAIADRRAAHEAGLEEAEERTREAQAALQACRTILAATLKVDDRINYSEFKRTDEFEGPPPEPTYHELPTAPPRAHPRYQPDLNLFDKLIPAFRRKKEQACQATFEGDTAKYQAELARLTDENQKIYQRALARHSAWSAEKEAYEKQKAMHNAAIDAKEAAYRRGEPGAVLEYCDLVLTRSRYPEFFPKEFSLDYRADVGVVIVDYTLPDFPSLPRLAEVRYNKSKDDFTEKNITESEAQRLYADVVVQTCLRTVHEIFEADTAETASSVVFNGWVRGINPATGRMEAICVISLHAKRAAFLGLNLEKVDPRLCVEQQGGIVSAKPHQMAAVRPLVTSSEDAHSPEPPPYAAQLDALAAAGGDPDGIVFIETVELRKMVAMPEDGRASVQGSRQLVEKLNADGYCVEPDASALGISYKANDDLALFKFPGRIATHPAPNYLGAATLLQLFHLVAAADGAISDDEARAIRSQVTAALGDDPIDRIRLKAYGALLVRRRSMASSNLTKVIRRLESGKREQVATALVHLAAADGLITEGERKVLGRILDLLELPAGTAEKILPGFGGFQEKLVVEATPEGLGEAIPPPAPMPAVRAPVTTRPVFALDAARIAAISRETAEVVKILSTVMTEEPPAEASPASPTVAAPVAVVESAWELSGLDPRFHAVANELFSRAEWPMGEFSALVARHHLMPAGVIDALNSWSDEHLGDFVLEGDDPILVRSDLLKSPA